MSFVHGDGIEKDRYGGVRPQYLKDLAIHMTGPSRFEYLNGKL